MTFVRTQFQPARSRKHRDAERKREVAAGIPSHVDAMPVRGHLQELLDLGMTIGMIARAAGLTPTGLRDIASGNRARVRHRHARAILDVTATPHPRQIRCLAIGARRRVNALSAAGWAMDYVAAQIGMSVDSLRNAIGREVITYSTWSAIASTYESLSGTPGPSKHAARRAKPLGFYLPMEWEGYDIDDPRVSPPRSRRTAGTCRRSARDELREQVIPMTQQGMTASEIAVRLKLSKRTIGRYLADTRRSA